MDVSLLATKSGSVGCSHILWFHLIFILIVLEEVYVQLVAYLSWLIIYVPNETKCLYGNMILIMNFSHVSTFIQGRLWHMKNKSVQLSNILLAHYKYLGL